MNIKIAKPIRFLVIGLLSFCVVKKFCESRTDKFTLESVTPKRAFNPEFEVGVADKYEMQKILTQPFTYLGYGAQAFIFESADKEYVLKLLKQRIYTTPLWHEIPIPFLDKYKKKLKFHREDKLHRDFSSYKLAYEIIPDLTGVVLVHLNPSSWLKSKIKIQDKLGIWHHIDADNMDFILQKKAELAHEKIVRLMKSNDIIGAKNTITTILSFIEKRCSLGFMDRDSSIDTNCGFLGDHMIKIDIGRISIDANFKNPKTKIEEIIKITLPFQLWIRQRFPELEQHLVQTRIKMIELIKKASDYQP
ncbi:MAG: hypothetical protein FJZ57_04600 [Chlamydiae bacterium]|nr:hypothetical protein [Chlamydiota bacterium]